MKRPKEVNILGITYKIEYVDKPSEVDIFKRDSLWGQIDYWTRSIRIYDNNTTEVDIWETIMHEVLHGIETALKLKCFKEEKGHEELGLVAMALTDILFRNGWFKEGDGK